MLVEQLQIAPDNQFGQYAEKWMKVIHSSNISSLLNVIEDRLSELKKVAHQKRASKIYLKLQKMKTS